jgi:replicative DNA helicase
VSSQNLAELFKYVETGVSLPNDKFRRNNIIDATNPGDLRDFRKKHNNTGIYITAYRYSTPKLEEIRDTELYADLYFDFDDENNFEGVREDALDALSYLKANFDIDYDVPNIFFSGFKGIHITIPAAYLGVTPSKNLHDIYKEIAKDVRDVTKNKTLDLRMYDKVRMFRLVNSVHQKTRLFKIRLTYDDLNGGLSYDEIKLIAQEPRTDIKKSEPTTKNERAETVIREYAERIERAAAAIRERNYDVTPIEVCPPCIEHILEHGVLKGNRNNTVVALADHYRQRGLSFHETLGNMLQWNAKVLQEPLSENEIEVTVTSVYNGVYRYGCRSLQDLSICDKSRCDLHKKEPMENTEELKPKLTNEEKLQQLKLDAVTFYNRELSDYEFEMFQIIDEVEEYNQNRGKLGGLTFGDSCMDASFNGLQPAMYILAGQPNIGKSMLALNLAWSVAMHNPNAYVIYFAIDDPNVAILPRIVALDQRIPINVAKIPAKYRTEDPQHLEWMAKRAIGLNNLKSSVNRFKMIDKKKGYSAEYISRVAKAHKTAFMREAEETGCAMKQLCLFIDNMYDVYTEERVSDPQRNLQIVSEKLDFLCETDLIPIFATGELKKLNGVRRPILDDLKDTIELQYDASAVMLCYNEVQIKGERAEVFHTTKGSPHKQPVLEVHVAKNKLGEDHGRLFYHMYPGFGHVTLIDDPQTRNFYISKIQN